MQAVISLQEFFEERFEALERAIQRVDKKLDCLPLLETRMALVEDRQRLIFWFMGVVGVMVIGQVVERVLSRILPLI